MTLLKIFSSKPPLKTLKPMPKLVIPIRSIATPAKRLASYHNKLKQKLRLKQKYSMK
ncbi:Na/Pi-cotransporter, putative [Campylobacter jejuni subsp. jejuni 414]|nr:Na/Pi-cotransporter, putative [Campylobacter jejuni subsp. jejuni 414]